MVYLSGESRSWEASEWEKQRPVVPLEWALLRTLHTGLHLASFLA